MGALVVFGDALEGFAGRDDVSAERIRGGSGFASGEEFGGGDEAFKMAMGRREAEEAVATDYAGGGGR